VASAWVPLTIADAAHGLRSGHWSSVDLVDASLAAIRAHNPRTNAFITVDEDAARLAAHTADVDRRRGIDRGPLHGVPISVKDLFDIAGQPTTAASRVLAGHVATQDATAVGRLRQAGAIFLGKTNLHEFALGSTGDDSAFGAVKHPLDSRRLAGGSSSGSAVAVALLMGLGSLGSDTGGSIRIPAAACGVVGLKPSLDEVPLDGAVPLSVTLDHAGPIARSVGDAAMLWAILAGRPTVSLEPPSSGSIALGAANGYFALVTDDVRAPYEMAISALRASGVSVRPVEIRGADRTVETYTNLALPEAAAWHAHYLERRPGDYTSPVRSRLEAGQKVTAVQYLTARQRRLRLTEAVEAALEGCQALVLPTLPIVAPLIGTTDVTLDPNQHQTMPVRAAMLRQTQLFNLTGHPAITLPVKTAGLPVGLQLVGRRGATADLLAVAAAIEGIVNQ
jgi:Asp-tRNA(Asn)/Glu-tRNA(Gln) amidotransferase A subunit family amidase